MCKQGKRSVNEKHGINMGFFTKIINNPTVGKFLLKIMEKRALKPFEEDLRKTQEKQLQRLKHKFARMEHTDIGKKLGIHKETKLQNIPITNYEFYEPFFNQPSHSAFMYGLDAYVKMRTSGTGGKEKWFMMPKEEIKRSLYETSMSAIFTIFHNGTKPTFEYGDIVYINTAPRPFAGGFMISETRSISGIVNVVPNTNLPYNDKVRYFILNYDKIDGAVMLASTLISQIMPVIKKPIILKGLFLSDSITAEAYKNEIAEFTGTIPKSSYQSTETLFSTVPSVQHPLGFMFDWRRGIFDFLPVKNGEVKGEVCSIDQVEIGKTYRLIFTSFVSELTRYDTKDSVICVAKSDDILGVDQPIFKFGSRLEKTISLHNFTRIDEYELLTALKDIGVKFVDFTARVELIEGLEHLIFYLEQTSKMTAEEIKKELHRRLYEVDRDYKDLADFFNYTPIKVRLLPRGTFAKYLSRKIAATPKVDRINMRSEDFQKLLQLMGT
jgi:hypothetical protein